MRLGIFMATLVVAPVLAVAAPLVTYESLLGEMADRDAVATFPAPPYASLQASSYHRASTARDQPDQGVGGWFADSDGTGFIRTEEINGKTEWVVMEHEGPGALTRMWTPFFYYNFNNRVGPNIRIYLDGSDTPVIDQNFIELLTNLDWGPEYGAKPEPQNTIAIPYPFAAHTARAGLLHLPIPFAKSCKVTFTEPAFYNIINYRAYDAGTPVKTFTLDDLKSPKLGVVAERLKNPGVEGGEPLVTADKVPAGGSRAVKLPAGPAAVRHLEITLDPAAVAADPSILRSLVLTATFDGTQTIWCPVGDFFSSSNRLNSFRTLPLEVSASDGRMICRWVMPYRESATIELHNLGENDVAASIAVRSGPWTWDDASMHFHANWRADDIIPGTPFLDWNFIEIHGQGVLVGDSWPVLNLTTGWWGEGDEKIYIDEDYDVKKFPSHFGTGTEDYYGWAGGVNPTRQDEFSVPWAANVQVGSRESNSTQGFNINMRTRSLDAIPFRQRLVFDMEASAGTGQRNAWNLLMYSVATYWYGKPGATSNRPPLPEKAARPITSFEDMAARSAMLRSGGIAPIPGAIEGEALLAASASPGLEVKPATPPPSANPDLILSGGRHLEIPFAAAGQFVEFRITEQFTRQRLRARLSTGPGHGIVNVSVNGRQVAEAVDTHAARLGVIDLNLGEADPVESAFTIRIISAGPGAGGGFASALDALVITDPLHVGIKVTTDLDFSDDTYRQLFDATAYGNGPTAADGALVFDGTTALRAKTPAVFGGTSPADNFGYEVLATPAQLRPLGILAGVVAADASNRGSFIYQNGGRYSLIEAAEGSVSATTAAQAGQPVALAFVMDNGTARLFVNGVEEANRRFSPGGPSPIDTATLGATVLGGNLFDNGDAPGGGSALGAFHGSIHRFRAFVFEAGGFQVSELLDTESPALFTLPREEPLRRVDPLPAGAMARTAEFAGKARPGEYFVFQLGVVAGSDALGPLRLIFSDLTNGADAISSGQIECLNLGGIGNDGKPFQKDLTLPPQRIQPLWCGVHIPLSATGTYAGTARLEAGGMVVGTYSLRIQVEGEPVANHGDDEAANLSRLRWLNSTIGSEPTVTHPFTNVEVSGRSVRVLGRELEVAPDGLPSGITSYFNDANTAITPSGRPVLSAPFRFIVERGDGPVTWQSIPAEIVGSDVEANWTGTMQADGLRADVQGRLDFAGSGEIAIRLTAESDMNVNDIRLEVPWYEEAARYFMGLGKEGGYRSNEKIDWRWDINKRQDCFWMGDVNAGLMLRLKDENFIRPLVNIYYEFGRLNLPDSWDNSGKGGVTVARASEGTVPVRAYSGPRTLKAGESLSFIFEIHLTPFRTLDTEKQWSTRFVHPKPTRDPATLHKTLESLDAEAGPNVLNIHQAHPIAPFINYPYADAYEPGLVELIKKAHEKGCRARIYYTTRELTQNLPELHALHSLNGEVIFPGPGESVRTILHRNGPHPWLDENLGVDFIPAWVDRIQRPEAEWDLSVITTPDSRWNNFYLEGLQRLVDRLGFDGVYIDDTALDARSLQRARRILDRKPGRLMDFHTWNHMNHHAGFANNLTIYMELLPYFDRLWIGEGFSMARPADFILVESSGLPFGLMSEMLDHPNPWRGLLYGQTTRLGWSGDPRPIWKAFDEFGIKGTEFIPYFSGCLPVRTGSSDVLASVYRRDGRSWVVLAGWSNEARDIQLEIDWNALGLDAGKAGLYAPAIAGMQTETLFRPGDTIPVAPGRGWVFILDQDEREIKTAQEYLAAAAEVFRYNFTAPKLSDAWRVHHSKQDEMDVGCFNSSLLITGAANRFAGAEHDLPPKVRAVELDIDPGTDRGQTWGPGVALVWPDGQAAKINWRAEDRDWGVFGAEGFRRAKGPQAAADQYRSVRIMLTPDQLLYQVKEGEHWQTVDTQSRNGRDGDPSAVRLGKLAENGSWTDFHGAPGEPGRAAVTDLRVLAE